MAGLMGGSLSGAVSKESCSWSMVLVGKSCDWSGGEQAGDGEPVATVTPLEEAEGELM